MIISIFYGFVMLDEVLYWTALIENVLIFFSMISDTEHSNVTSLQSEVQITVFLLLMWLFIWLILPVVIHLS